MAVDTLDKIQFCFKHFTASCDALCCFIAPLLFMLFQKKGLRMLFIFNRLNSCLVKFKVFTERILYS